MRQHVEHVLAAFGALGVALFISYFNTGANAVTVATLTNEGKLTPVSGVSRSFVPATTPLFTVPTTTPESLIPGLDVVVQKAKPKLATPTKPTPTQKPSAPTESTAPVVTAPEAPVSSTGDNLLDTISLSVVNILCTSHTKQLRGVSGTGVIIDSRGIVLTVAHVAQAVLLEQTLGKGVISCVVRTGNPAKNAYRAKLLYISEAWVRSNSTTLISSQPTGTGENDFALLAITSSATSAPLPSTYPAIRVSTTPGIIGQKVALGSYGAQYLTTSEVTSHLAPTLVYGKIKDVYTFTTTSSDVLAIYGGKAAQEGSSGGAAVNTSGALIGLITTSELSGDESTRELRVITPTHMRRSFKAGTGGDFDTYYDSGSIISAADSYSSKIQDLGNFLAKAIGFK